MVIVRGSLVLLQGEQRIEIGVLLGAPVEHEQHALHGKIGRRGSEVELRLGQRMTIAAEGGEPVGINGLGDPRGL